MPRRGAGKYRWKLTLKKDGATTANAANELVESPSVVASKIPAGIRTTTGDERRHAHAVEAGATHIVTIRYRTGITHDMWFSWGSRRLDISGPALDQTNECRELEIPCREAV